MSPDAAGFFDQLGSFQLLLDLLYENGRYEDMLKVYTDIKSRMVQGTKYPRNSVVLVLAACYKLVRFQLYSMLAYSSLYMCILILMI